MQAALVDESTAALTFRGDTPHVHYRQAPWDGNGTGDLMSGSEISPDEAVGLLQDLTTIVAQACAEIRAVSPTTVVHRLKPDQSPVTAADEASEATILRGLARLLPGVPVISEESAHNAQTVSLTESFLIVDPLDGTREFLAGRDEFTVNLSIITRGVPIAGIIAAPARDQLWRGVVGKKAERVRLTGDGIDAAAAISARRWPDRGAVAAVSRSHYDSATEAFLRSLGPLTRQACGSAIKFCQIAEGSVDIYPRLATTCEWDVAAGHALVVAAGGNVLTPQGTSLAYGRIAENFRVPAFIAWGDPARVVAVKA